MSRITVLVCLALGIFLFIGTIIFLAQDNRAAKLAAAKKNIEEKKGKVIDEKTNQPKKFPVVSAKVRSFEFGVRSNFAEFTRKFPITNEGEVPLNLTVETPSCPCLTARIPKGVVAPGETIELEVGAKPAGKAGDYSQYVEILTNDPQNRVIRFGLVGRFQKIFWTEPEIIAFQDMLPDEERQLEMFVLTTWEKGFNFNEFEVTPATLKFEVQDLTPVEAEDKGAKSGKRIRFTCPAELKDKDFGAARFTFQSEQLGTEFKEQIALAVTGNRIGRMSILGDRSLDEFGRLDLGQILTEKGLTKKMSLKARGKQRSVTMKNIVVDPPAIQVAVVPNADAATSGNHILTIEIPAGTPLMSHMGKNHGKIVLDFEDEEYKDIELQVSFAVIDEASLK